MLRQIARVAIAAFSLWSCGPDKRECSGPHADFDIVLKLANRPLPADTVVRVTYGGSGMEEYSLAAARADHEVVFCDAVDANGMVIDASLAAAGEVQSLHCALWTAGFTKLDVRATGLAPMTYQLSPREGACFVKHTIVLDSPDAG